MTQRDRKLEALYAEVQDIDQKVSILKARLVEINLAVQSAAAEGDLRENSDYDTQLRAAEITLRQISEQEDKRKEYSEMKEITSTLNKDVRFASIGSLLVFEDQKSGVEHEMLLVTSRLGDGIERLSVDSRVGEAFYGKPVGTVAGNPQGSTGVFVLTKIIGGEE